MVGQLPEQCLAPEAAQYLTQQLARGARSVKGYADESRVATALGLRTLRSRTLLSQNREGQADYVLFVAEDATEELAAHAQIHYMAHHDALTGLPNRTLFSERLKQALGRGQDSGKLTATLCLDPITSRTSTTPRSRLRRQAAARAGQAPAPRVARARYPGPAWRR